ncbi:MAG: transposase [Desulforhopalus sp.]
MAKYKPYSYSQGQFIPVFFNKQIQKGIFEYSLSYLVNNELDLSIFAQRFRNDETGAPAYDLRILLKIIVFACFLGITSSRAIARCCEENVLFMSLRPAVGEPPVVPIRPVLGLDKFTLRGKRKVNSQWNLFCIGHNLKKLHSCGMGFA